MLFSKLVFCAYETIHNKVLASYAAYDFNSTAWMQWVNLDYIQH